MWCCFWTSTTPPLLKCWIKRVSLNDDIVVLFSCTVCRIDPLFPVIPLISYTNCDIQPITPLKRLKLTLNMLRVVKCAAGAVFPHSFPWVLDWRSRSLGMVMLFGEPALLVCHPFSLMLSSVCLIITFILIKVILFMSPPDCSVKPHHSLSKCDFYCRI